MLLFHVVLQASDIIQAALASLKFLLFPPDSLLLLHLSVIIFYLIFSPSLAYGFFLSVFITIPWYLYLSVSSTVPSYSLSCIYLTFPFPVLTIIILVFFKLYSNFFSFSIFLQFLIPFRISSAFPIAQMSSINTGIPISVSPYL